MEIADIQVGLTSHTVYLLIMSCVLALALSAIYLLVSPPIFYLSSPSELLKNSPGWIWVARLGGGYVDRQDVY